MTRLNHRITAQRREAWEYTRKHLHTNPVSVTIGKRAYNTKHFVAQAVDGNLLYCRQGSDSRSDKALVFDMASREIVDVMTWGEMVDRYFADETRAAEIARAEAKIAALTARLETLRAAR